MIPSEPNTILSLYTRKSTKRTLRLGGTQLSGLMTPRLNCLALTLSKCHVWRKPDTMLWTCRPSSRRLVWSDCDRLLVTSGTKVLISSFLSPCLFHLKVMEATVLPPNLPPDLCLSSAACSFLLGSAICIVSCDILYEQEVPLQTMSNKCNVPQVDSKQGDKISQRWSREMGGWLSSLSNRFNRFKGWIRSFTFTILLYHQGTMSVS